MFVQVTTRAVVVLVEYLSSTAKSASASVNLVTSTLKSIHIRSALYTSTIMAYSQWLGLAPGQVLCRTFHITQGSGPDPGPENDIFCINIGKCK